jgi:hypothetical protein
MAHWLGVHPRVAQILHPVLMIFRALPGSPRGRRDKSRVRESGQSIDRSRFPLADNSVVRISNGRFTQRAAACEDRVLLLLRYRGDIRDRLASAFEKFQQF